MSYIQNLFTSRDNNSNAATNVGQLGRLWYDPVTNTIYVSDGVTPGGIPVGAGGSGNGTPGGPTNSVQINAGDGNFTGSTNLVFSNNVLSVVGNVSATGNVTASYFLGNVSTVGNVVGGNILSNNYLYANGNSIFANVQLTGNIDLGNLYVIDETIYGKNVDQDIVLSPAGDGYVSVPKLKIPVGTVLENTQVVVPIISSLTLSSVLDYSTGPDDTLPSGTYGIPGGATPPWTAYQFTTVPTPSLEPQDIVSGAGVPADSQVVYVGTGSGNTNIVVTTQTYQDLPTPVPTPGTTINVARALTKAGLSISTIANTDIGLNPGNGGNTVIASSLIPLTDNQFTIGSPARRIKSMYLGGGTIYIFDEVLGVDQAISASNGNLVVQGGTGLNVGEFTLFANTIAIANSAANINIGVGSATGNVVFNRPIAVNANVAYPYPTFTVSRDGLVDINIASLLPANQSALNINGAASGNTYPRNFSATLLQLTNLDQEPARFSGDAFGANVGTGQNAYFAIASRVARGNVDAPSQTQANDLMMRVTSQGFNNAGAFQGSIVRYNQIARENFTTTAAGTRHNFQATPTGTVTIKNIANIDAQGITLSSVATGGPANIGITFQDGSFQNTAYLASQAVNSVTAATGISIAPTNTSATGNITITNIGVITTAGTANQVFVNGANNISAANGAITLSLPQDIGTNSSPTFNTLTVNNLNILGNVSNVIPSVIGGKIVYVANTATQLTDIDTSGLVTGNAANGFYAGMLYQTTGAYANTWDFSIGNSQGIYAGNVYGDAGQFVDQVHVGFGNATIDYPQAGLQVDTDVDSYTQIVLQNHNQGANASADFVAVANNGDDGNFYIDMGINSNVYNNSDYALTGPNDGYLYVNGGNLIIGTQTAAKTISFFTGGTDSTSRIRGTVSDAGLSMVGNVTANNVVGNTVSATTVSATGNVNAANVAATTITATNLSGTNITGTLQTAAQNNITSVGTLSSLSVTGTVTSGNIATAGNVSATGNVTGGNLVTPGTIVNSGIITTGSISAFGNITSSANVTGGNVITNRVVGTGLTLSSTGNLIFAPTGNINANTHYINNVINPVQAQDAATKNYVDTTIASSIVNADWTATSGTAEIINKTGASGPTTIALGQNAAGNVQGANAIAIGIGAAGSTTTSQGVDAIAIGTNAGGALAQAQGDGTIAIGKNAGGAGFGTDGQQTWSIAVGTEAGTSNQAAYSVALGAYAGRYNQGSYATALGQAAGLQSQGNGAVAIGQAGYESQGAYAVAIGSGAGDTNQGNNAIAIGYQAGSNNQTANSIILNASGSALDTSGVAGLFIAPVRNNLASNANPIFFNTGTKELTYANTILLAGNISGANLITSGLITATGNISGGNISATNYTGTTVSVTANITGGNIATIGLVTVTGNVQSGNIRTVGMVSATGNVIGAYGIFSNGNTVINAGISTTGNVTGNYFFGNGSQLTGIATSTYGNANVANFLANYGANTISTTGNITGNYYIGNGSQLTGVIKTLGNAFTTISSNGVSITANTSTSTATLTPGNNITIVGNASTNITVFSVVDSPVFIGNITGGNIRTTGVVSATGNITANYFIGNGSQLTNLNVGIGGNQLVYVLNAQQTIGSAKNTLLSLFGLTNGVALTSNTRYQYELLFNAQCSKAGVLSYALALSGGAVVAQHNYNVISNKTTAIDNYTAGITMMSLNATGAAITTAQTVADTATFNHTIIQGTIDVTTGGNVNFMVSQDQNTPVTWTINAGSYVKLLPLGPIGANTADGTWS